MKSHQKIIIETAQTDLDPKKETPIVKVVFFFYTRDRVGSGGDEVPCRSSPPITTDPQPIVAYLQLGRVRAVYCVNLYCIKGTIIIVTGS